MNTTLFDQVGNTPLVNLEISGLENVNLYTKLEYLNPTGSVKDRAANYIINKLLASGEINQDTVIIESSSGNFGIALAAYCKMKGLKFYCVVDPNITPLNEFIIQKLSTLMIKVTEPDSNAGYLLNRIEKVKELTKEIQNSYWINQYANPYNAEAYYQSLGNEICNEVCDIDYVFVGISSGGTITGLSKCVSERYKNAKIIAVDTVGSVIFGGKPLRRYIPGIGSSLTPEIIKSAIIHEVINVHEVDAAKMCHRILEECFIIAGGSSGAVISAIEQYFKGVQLDRKPNVVTIFADSGNRYSSTIYNNEWFSSFCKLNENKVGLECSI